MRKSVIALVAVVVLAGAAVAAVPVIERHAAASIKSEIERNGTAKVDEVSVSLLARRVTLVNLKSKSAAEELNVGRWEASGLALAASCWPAARRWRAFAGAIHSGPARSSSRTSRWPTRRPAADGAWMRC